MSHVTLQLDDMDTTHDFLIKVRDAGVC